MRHLKANISVTITLGSGESKTIMTDDGTIELDQFAADSTDVAVLDNRGREISGTGGGDVSQWIACAVADWLLGIGITDDDSG